jgi:hypothetical protein
LFVPERQQTIQQLSGNFYTAREIYPSVLPALLENMIILSHKFKIILGKYRIIIGLRSLFVEEGS